jgi:predicted nucleotidyltransferase
MRLEFYPAEKLKKEIKEIIGKYLDLKEYKIFIFGSRIAGKGDERSDIDIGIIGNYEIPYEVMAKIKEEIDNLPLLYKVDVVDFRKVSQDFKKIALQHTEAVS